MRREFKIIAGGMFQEWDSLIDLLTEDKAKTLENLAKVKGWRVIQPSEAENMGFKELVEWSIPETDLLVFIDNNFLVCIPRTQFEIKEN